MDSPTKFLILTTHIHILLLAVAGTPFTFPHSVQINSNSILVALLDSHYTDLAELLEKALLLQTIEQALSNHNITIFAPNNQAFDPEFKRFLLQPANLNSLQDLILFHVIKTRVNSDGWPTLTQTLSNRNLNLTREKTGRIFVGLAQITHPDSITRPDGVIHGIQRLLIPPAVENEFNRRRSLRSIAAVKPEGAPEVDRRSTGSPEVDRRSTGAPARSTHRFKTPPMAPGPVTAPAPAPGPGGHHPHFDGEAQVKDFIATLLQYGGYNEFADILVNLTSLATEIGRLVSEGYVLTVLAPNDEAMAKLSTEQLSDPGAPEQIMYYHLIPEYQTEESMYNAVRRFGKVSYDTLRVARKVVAREADGSVKFGSGDGAAYLFDPDIYTDGRISVQGIDGVLLTPEEKKEDEVKATRVLPKSTTRRGKLLEVTCQMLRTVGQGSRFSTCE
ncbi:FASCICLIN-like arabinogalactan protein 16 precursor [Euphorbia peplus]|nr:FASCICLIN-like arabinogalactan protein 16 precursor [Euphorbia peplus]